MRDLHKVTTKSKYNLINSDYRYEYPVESKPVQPNGISRHLLFIVFFCLAGFLFYLTQLAQSVIASGATREGVLILFSFLTAGIFLILFKGGRS
jgi:hypothetical protein